MHLFQRLAVACAAAASVYMPAVAAAQCVPAVSGTSEFVLYAGQNIQAGTVSATVAGDALVVTYNTMNGWELTETHLWIGSAIGELPQTHAGNPTPGKFPYKSHVNGSTTHSVSIPLAGAEINFACPGNDSIYYMAAHASLRKRVGSAYQTETGWSAGSRITGKGNWATFSTITLTCLCAVQSPSAGAARCETAFAHDPYANTSFLDSGFSRWGWSNGPYDAGRYTLDIYAGAGQGNIAKGTHVGFLTVDYSGALATVTYTTKNGWFMNETHLHVGADRFPTVKQGNKLVYTVSPGQFAYQRSLDEATIDSYSVTASGPIYVIAHAVVCVKE